MATLKMVIGIVVTACIVFALVFLLQGCSASRSQLDKKDSRDFVGGTVLFITCMDCKYLQVKREGNMNDRVDRGHSKDDKAVKIQPPGK